MPLKLLQITHHSAGAETGQGLTIPVWM